MDGGSSYPIYSLITKMPLDSVFKITYIKIRGLIIYF